MNDNKLLSVDGLSVKFYSENSEIKAVEDLSFSLYKGEFLGIVGESGCGKTVTALSILRLIPDPPGKIYSGSILFNGIDLLSLSWDEIRRIRGNRISMIFQEPMTALNPVLTIGEQIIETILAHTNLRKNDAKEKTIQLLEQVGIANAKDRLYDYPHQFSGGMRQRAMIAMALSCDPDILIADEPTTALDVTVQAQILDLMNSIKEKNSERSIMFITHNMGIVYENCDRVIVMYSGRIAEVSTKNELFKNPLHPYTVGLLKAIPTLSDTRDKKLYTIPGSLYDTKGISSCCLFYPRCERCMDICKKVEPELLEVEKGHYVRCHLYTK